MKRLLKKINRKSITFIAVLIITLTALFVINKYYEPNQLKYTEFLELVENEEIKRIDLRGNDDIMYVFTIDDVKHTVDNPKTETFKEQMLKEGISVENNTPVLKKALSIFMLVLQIGIFALIIIIVLNFTKSTRKGAGKTVNKESPKVTFDNIAGNMEAKEDMKFLVNFLKDPDKYRKIGAKLPKGVVLYGPPGTGKTLMAKAVAGEAKVPFYYATGSDFVEMYVGLGAKRVRDLFKVAKENSPSIVFIDEIDAVGSHRGSNKQSSENDQTINALLSELDGFDSNDSVIVIVATNRIEDLDPALIRPGRFDRHVSINLPDYNDRREILKIHSKDKNLHESVNLDSLANITIGFSGASLEALMNEAAIIAVNNGSDVIREEDIDESYFKIAMKGNKKVNKNKDEGEIKLVAYHEAGHALATKLLTNNHLHKVTIIPSTSGAGGATFSVPKKTSLISKREILNNIMVLYAGRAAEEILKGNKDDITSGASQDIKQATNYIKAYFSEFGMSSKFGMLAINNDELYLDEAVKLSNQLYKDTLELLKNNKSHLDAIANSLIDKETLNGDEIDELLRQKETN